MILASNWADGFTSAGAAAVVLGTIGGALIALFYGRKATVTVEGFVRRSTDDRLVLAARATVRAVGVLRLRFDPDEVPAVTVTEQWMTATGIEDGRKWIAAAVFGGHFVEAGETIATTVIFDLPPPPEVLVGWRVSLRVTVGRRLRGGQVWAWDDRVFIPLGELAT